MRKFLLSVLLILWPLSAGAQTCPAGSSPLPWGVTRDATTDLLRQIFCVELSGKVKATELVIGSVTPSTGAFTTLSATGAVTLSPASAAVVISPTGTGTVAISPVGALTVNPTAASTINNTSIGVTIAAAAKHTTITETYLLISNAAPTISSGFGTSPSISSNNGTASFRVNVGTGGTATSGVIGLATATAGWNCSVNNITAAAAHVAYNTRQIASTTTTVTLENQTTSTGAAVAWAASDILAVSCFAY